MLRVSDGRMSGTAGGTIVLHVAPEAADPTSALGIVRDGDVITVDVGNRVLRVEISDEEMARRIALRQADTEDGGKDTDGKGEGSTPNKAPWVARHAMRGYRGLYMREVNQADRGADFEFLTAGYPDATLSSDIRRFSANKLSTKT